MDNDDLPLSALAKAPKFDDDTPLASLASVVKPKGKPSAVSPAGKPGTPRASSGGKLAPLKGSPKTTPKIGEKRKAGSDSDSSSSSDSDSSSSDDKPMKKAAPKGKARPKKAQTVKKSNDKGGEDGDEGSGDDDEEAQAPINKRNRSVKEQCVAELLCRWWYVLPDWPPTDAQYYDEQLKKKGLRKVTIQEWEWVPETNGDGLRKCYELSAFPGLVRDSAGDLIDLRPRETCPCYANMMKKDLPDLYNLLAKAYENQLEELKKSSYDESALRLQLQGHLTRVRNKANQAASLSGTSRKTAGT